MFDTDISDSFDDIVVDDAVTADSMDYGYSKYNMSSISHSDNIMADVAHSMTGMMKRIRDLFIKYKELTFNIKPMGFKHTGLFPEQAVNWDWMINKIKEETKKKNREIKVLNLFAYTGGASVACSYAGASVCHVDSSKGMVAWAKENIVSSGLSDRPVRFIIDDVTKFVQREIRRGNKYDAIIMDPPSYGRGKNGEVWQFESNLEDLVELCSKVLSDNPLFFLINSYTTGISSKVLENILSLKIKNAKGKITSGEIGLPMTDSSLVLPCGIYGRWEKK